jgi:hypothetical protein
MTRVVALLVAIALVALALVVRDRLEEGSSAPEPVSWSWSAPCPACGATG